MNYIGISDFDTANGPGVRVSLFVSGCRLRCRGCFNPESWDFDAGKPYDESVQERLLKALEEDYVDGLSLLGGDPLEPENVEVLTELCRAVREKFGNKKTIWLRRRRTIFVNFWFKRRRCVVFRKCFCSFSARKRKPSRMGGF